MTTDHRSTTLALCSMFLLVACTSATQSSGFERQFRMPIDDVFKLTIPNKVVVVGVIQEGSVKPGMKLAINAGGEIIPVKVEGIEKGLSNPVNYAQAGDNVGILLAGISKEQISPGDLLLERDDSN